MIRMLFLLSAIAISTHYSALAADPSTKTVAISAQFYESINSTSNGSGVGASFTEGLREVSSFGSRFDRRLVFEFSLSSIQGTVKSAQFSFQPFDNFTQFEDFTVILDAYEGNNSRDVSDYHSMSLGTIASFSMKSLPEYMTKTYDVTQLLDLAVRDNFASIGFRLRQGDETGFNTRGATYFREKLTVEYFTIPEPGSVSVMAIGVGTLPLIRRRRIQEKQSSPATS